MTKIDRNGLKVDENLGETTEITRIGFGDFARKVGRKTPNKNCDGSVELVLRGIETLAPLN